MVNPCPDGFCLTWNFDDPYDGTQGATHPFCYYNRPVYETRIRPNGTSFYFYTGAREWGWQSGYVREVTAGESYGTLAEYHKTAVEWGGSNDYFTIDPATRSRCFSPFASTPPPSPILRGTASLPPPPPRNMCGCDCNTIASIIAEHMAEKQRLLDAIKEHVDMRTLEQLKHTNEMLQSIDMDLDLQPVIDEMKRVEANLWNGISGGG